MNAETRGRVPGEDVPVAVPGGLLAVGLLFVSSAVGAANLQTPERGVPEAVAAREPSAMREPFAAPNTSVAETPTTTTTPTATATAECHALVVRFANGATDGPPAAGSALAALAQHLVATPDAHALIEGHADAVGDEIYNLRLSRERAAWVANKLRDLGVIRSQITVRGLGAFSPVAGLPETESANRRVVVIVRGGTACAAVPKEEVR